jgi:L-ascorbate metabolism protein UlaG (beta-lactamase superfamily)
MRKLSIFSLIFISNIVSGQHDKMINEIMDHRSGTAVWWVGQASWIIKSGDLVISTDLFLDPGGRIDPAPVTPEEIAPILDISFVTHGHGDHFDPYTTKVLVEKSKCMFVIPESCLETARKLKIPDARLVIAKPREPFEIKGIKVVPLRAIHGMRILQYIYDANMQDCGYLFTINGKQILQPGDTYLLEDHLFLKKVDVLSFHRPSITCISIHL